MIGGAVFSRNKKYRHHLWREWSGKRWCNFICLNPSIADAKKNDHSVTKMIGFAERLGCGGLSVTNIFDIITTYPSDLHAWFADRELSSRVNNRYLFEAAEAARIVICAWGNHGDLLDRNREVMAMFHIRGINRKLFALRINSNGNPAHPLMLPYSARPVKYGEAHVR